MAVQSTRQFISTEERRTYVVRAYLLGKNQLDLAEECGVTQQQISLDMAAIRQEWKEARIRDYEALKDQEDQVLLAVRAAAWDGWERSLKAQKTRTRQRTSGKTLLGYDGQVIKSEPTSTTTAKREERVGDPRFLERIQKSIDQRCALFGLLAPVEVTETVKVTVEERTREANERLAKLRHDLVMKRQGDAGSNGQVYAYEEADIPSDPSAVGEE